MRVHAYEHTRHNYKDILTSSLVSHGWPGGHPLEPPLLLLVSTLSVRKVKVAYIHFGQFDTGVYAMTICLRCGAEQLSISWSIPTTCSLLLSSPLEDF